MSSEKNYENIVFEEGYYREPIANIFENYMNDASGPKVCPECLIKVSMPDREKNYFEEAEKIEGFLKEHWLKTMNCFRNFSKQTAMQAAVVEKEGFTKEADEEVLVSYGIAPYLSRWSPYHGALYTVVLSFAKLVACGADYHDIQLDFEQYYDIEDAECAKRIQITEIDQVGDGKQLSALLGAYEAKTGFEFADMENEELAQLGNDLLKECFGDESAKPDFRAVAMGKAKKEHLVTTNFKRPDNKIVRFCIPYDKYDRPIYKDAMKTYKKFYKMVKNGYIQSAYAVGIGGTMEALAKMSYKNDYGVRIDEDIRLEQLSQKAYGAIVAEIKPRDIRHIEVPCMFLGEVIEEPIMEYKNEIIELDELFE